MEERKIEGAVSHEVSPNSLEWATLISGLLFCSSRLPINFDIPPLARHCSVSAAARNVFNLARTVRDQYMASRRTCSTYRHRAGSTSSDEVEVGAGKGSTPVRNEEAGLLDCLYHGPVSLPICLRRC
jgi:hypothetical protein